MADDQNGVTLATIDPKTGKAPVERVTSAMLVNSLADRYIEQDGPRAIKRALVQAQLDGQRPYSQKKLEKAGQSDRSNVPYREAEGHVKARIASYVNLIFSVKCLVTVTVKDPKLDDHSYGETISAKFHDMLMEWPGFIYNMLLHQQEMVTYWSGPVYWPDPISWHFKAMKHGSFLVDSGADSTLDTLTNFLVRGTMKAHELYWKFHATDAELKDGITDEMKRKTAADHGWNYELAKELIVAANKGSTKQRDDEYQTSWWESIQQQIKNNDTLYSDAQSEEIQLRHWFQREFGGKVSWYIVPEKYPTGLKEFLFKAPNQYDDFTQVACLFASDIGSGSYHSGTGMGTKIYAHCVSNDRMKNKMVDATDLAMSILVKGDSKDVRPVKIGRFTVLPASGVSIESNAFNPDVDKLLKVCDFFEKDLARNVGTDRPDMDDHTGKPADTATESRLRLSREGKLERTDIMIYYQQADTFFREIKRRVFLDGLAPTDESYASVKKFKDACIEAGVPKALLKDDMLDIEATRSVGFGSAAYASDIYNDAVSVAGHLPEVGKTRAVRGFLSAKGGWRFAESLMPDTDMAHDPSNQQSFAKMENSLMELGGEVMVGNDQLHLAHIEVHIEPLMQIAKQFVSTGGVGDNPLKTHDFFLGDLHHTAQHLDLIKDDATRKPEYKKYMAQFDELVKVYAHLDKMVKKLQEDLKKQQQEQQQAEMQRLSGQQDPKAQAALLKVQADAALAQQHEASRQQVAEVKASHMMNLKDRMAAHKMALDERTAATAR